MYYYIKGELVAATLNMAVVDAGGVGYKMTVSENTYRSLPRRGDKNPVVTLYTYLSVREDGIELFGFANERELSSFKMLLSVSGVGPKAAMAIVSLLRDKLMKDTSIDEDLSTAVLDHSAEAAGAPARGKISEAMDALLVLGYTRAEAQKALSAIDTQALSIEDIIKEALKKLMKS